MEAEITAQLRELKRALDIERNADMAKLRSELTKMKSDIVALRNEVRNIPTSAPNNQLAIRQQAEMSVAISNKVKKDILAHIEKKVMPEIERVSSWVQYTTQDTDGLLTDYRTKVMGQSDSDALRLTDGRNNKAPATKGKFGPWVTPAFDDDGY